ncbi:transcription initiation factor TFIID subunit 7-like [Montipora capricornis]|uniref:transcription initiation factor TFIID subunit 7-like n=1 Tax=Montipora foliosa TaxID=591990 RepID=UPI0035F19D82
MSSKSRADGNELEKEFILRVPQVYASALQHAIQNGSLRDRLSIEFQADYRHATVRFDGAALSAKMLDLPCITESHKTVDNKSFYKTADVCQMLVCSEDDSMKEDENISPKKESKKFVWNHGITGPLKNVRKRRFRKTAKKKLVESPEIEKEVKRLLRTDLSASNVTFEVLQDEEKQDENVVSDAELLNTSMSSPLLGTQIEEQDGGSDDEDRNELFAILQEASSDEQDDADTQEEDDNEVNVDVEMDEDSQFTENESQSKVQINALREKLKEVRSARAEQETRVREASNLFLKQRFEKDLEEIKSKEGKLELELCKLDAEIFSGTS